MCSGHWIVGGFKAAAVDTVLDVALGNMSNSLLRRIECLLTEGLELVLEDTEVEWKSRKATPPGGYLNGAWPKLKKHC